MRLVTLKTLVVSFAMVGGAIEFYIITFEEMKCSELNFLQKFLSFSKIGNDRFAY